jgi:UPF0271 protein
MKGKSKALHINLDAGEGLVDEQSLYPYVHALNIACGGHAGDAETIAKTIQAGAALGLDLGAHPSYPDREHFGRRTLEMSHEALKQSLNKQLELFDSQCKQLNSQWTHIKAHGALYNDMAQNASLTEVYLEAIAPFSSGRILYVQEHSVLAQKAKDKGLKCYHEYFIDRRYADRTRLLSRSDRRAIISTPEESLTQLRLMQSGILEDVTQGRHSIEPHTFCIHSDHENTAEILKRIHEA